MKSPIRYVHSVGHCGDCQQDVQVQVDYKDNEWASSVPTTCRDRNACLRRVLMADCKFIGGEHE